MPQDLTTEHTEGTEISKMNKTLCDLRNPLWFFLKRVPELPDVEAIRRYLASQDLVGRAVIGVELRWPRAVRAPTPERLATEITGRRVVEIRRRGKYLVLPLSGRPSRTLILHLGMTGSLAVHPAESERPCHTRNVLLHDGGLSLCFVDPRKLGAMWLVSDEAEVLAGLGPEPLGSEFTPEVLARLMAGRRASIKALLCDQGVVAGIGNIYADEVLFVAGIHPLKRGNRMSRPQMRRLHEAIVSRLSEATEHMAPLVAGGGPPTEGSERLGLLLLPRSEGAPCKRCGTPVRRVVVRGRSTYFCPRDQKK